MANKPIQYNNPDQRVGRHIQPQEINYVQVETQEGWQYIATYNGKEIRLARHIEDPNQHVDKGTPRQRAQDIVSQAKDASNYRNQTDSLDEEEDEQEEQSEQNQPKQPHISNSVFRQRLLSVMTDNQYDRYVKGRRRGKLDMTRLPKAKTGSERIFTQKQARKNKKYNIILLVDESGSMGGERIETASECVTFLSSSFQGINMELSIVGYNHFLYTHKEFGESVDHEQLMQGMQDRTSFASEGAGCTHDYEALEYAYRKFAGMDGQNILIYMTDGEPNTCNLNEAYTRLRKEKHKTHQEAVDHILGRTTEDLIYGSHGGEPINYRFDTNRPFNMNSIRGLRKLAKSNASAVDTIGIGIQEYSEKVPEMNYIDEIEELKPMILGELRKRIRRGT